VDVLIRRAIPDEAPILTSIALSSKAVWGYDDDFIEQCREELTLTPEYVFSHEVYVAEADQQIIGFYGLIVDEAGAVLDYLYVTPNSLRQGVGRKLWQHLTQRARCLCVRSISIDADPHAENFYLAMGAERIGVTPSGSIQGRMLPLMVSQSRQSQTFGH
jgi:GNAT superfamily N-acetyltransferase